MNIHRMNAVMSLAAMLQQTALILCVHILLALLHARNFMFYCKFYRSCNRGLTITVSLKVT